MSFNKPTVNERLMGMIQALTKELAALHQNELTTRMRVHRLERYVDGLRDLTGHSGEQLDERTEALHPSLKAEKVQPVVPEVKEAGADTDVH